jgi:general secretion pathway protein I
MTGKPRASTHEHGFSLLEVVVAVAVFSLGALAVLNVLGQGSLSTVADESQAVAAIVAENRLAEAMAQTTPPPTGVTRGRETALSRSWDWEMRVGPSPQPRILRIDVSVNESGSKQTLASLASFRAAP